MITFEGLITDIKFLKSHRNRSENRRGRRTLVQSLIFEIENIKPMFYLTFMDVFFTLLAGREMDYLDVQRDKLKILSLTNSRNKSTLFFNPFKESDFKVNEFPSTSKTII